MSYLQQIHGLTLLGVSLSHACEKIGINESIYFKLRLLQNEKTRLLNAIKALE